MDSIINKLSEIELASSSIVEHAESQKNILEQEMQQMKARFDHELEQRTQAELKRIQMDLSKELNKMAQEQTEQGVVAAHALTKEYDENHKEYARSIFKNIVEV